ncbi:kynurenine 3-monooxygenase [Xylaria acuta]|nr:kynurenine 3-monooxygenase [Xylaria acuta]
MPLTAPPTEVAIIGGGLAGLTLALALHNLNIPATVYEARSEDFGQGGGVMLSPNALRVLDSVGVYERVRDKSLQFDVLTFKDGWGETTDEYYFGSQKLYGHPAIHGPDEVEFVLANGQIVSVPLVIGADGIHSTVRGTFMPQVKPIYAGFMGINSVVPRSKLRIPDGYNLPATVMAKPGAFVLVPQKPDGSELFIGSQRRFAELDAAGWESLRKDKQKLYNMFQENGADLPDVVQSALEATPIDRMGFWAFYGIPPLASWLPKSKRIILGANQAFEDARALATLLAKLSPEVYRLAHVKKVLDLTQQMDAKRLPESERAKLPPGAIWSDSSLTHGGGGELRWLYDPGLAQEAEKWVQELKQAAQSCAN